MDFSLSLRNETKIISIFWRQLYVCKQSLFTWKNVDACYNSSRLILWPTLYVLGQYALSVCGLVCSTGYRRSPVRKWITVRPWDTRPRAARTSQVHVFELGPKKFEMNEFMKWKPWAARFSDHLAFTLLSNKSCTNFELHEFSLSPKNVLLKALLYSDIYVSEYPISAQL